MKMIRRSGVLLLAAAILALASCARSTQPKPAPQTNPALPAAPVSVPTPPQAEPPAKTIIPAEERKAAVDGATIEEKRRGETKTAAALEEALQFYQDAKSARERDDLDGALKALDDAFAVLLRISVPADSPEQREKTDLRLLIAQRIQEIYASRRKPIADNHKSILFVVNKWVQREIDSFRGPERPYFEEAVRRAGLYRGWIEEQLRAAGLPEDLVWLPVIESWYMPRAQSYAWALGIWQFIGSTGVFYGLNRDRFIDERMDPYKSTKAAIRYLSDLHGMFGEWTTALAAYNCGEGYVQRVIATQHIDTLDNFWDLFERLPFQTARYVPRFIATVLIIRDPAKYGFVFSPPYPPLVFDTVTVRAPVKLSALAAAVGLDAAELSYLNPELRYESTPDREYTLRVPAGAAGKVAAAIETLPRLIPPADKTLGWHVVRSGETLSAIASLYGTSVLNLQKLNGLRDAVIRVGQRLKVPVRG